MEVKKGLAISSNRSLEELYIENEERANIQLNGVGITTRDNDCNIKCLDIVIDELADTFVKMGANKQSQIILYSVCDCMVGILHRVDLYVEILNRVEKKFGELNYRKLLDVIKEMEYWHAIRDWTDIGYSETDAMQLVEASKIYG